MCGHMWDFDVVWCDVAHISFSPTGRYETWAAGVKYEEKRNRAITIYYVTVTGEFMTYLVTNVRQSRRKLWLFMKMRMWAALPEENSGGDDWEHLLASNWSSGTMENFTAEAVCKLSHGKVKRHQNTTNRWAPLAPSHPEVERDATCCFICQQTLETCLYNVCCDYTQTRINKRLRQHQESCCR